MKSKEILLKKYSQTLEEATDKNLLRFIGPRAIFDPNFLPPVFFPQKKIAMNCQGILTDALEDEYSTNINLYGLKGTGKNLLISHLLTWTFQQSSPIKRVNKDQMPFHLIRIDCTQKDLDQIFFQLLTDLGAQIQLQFQIEKLQTYSSAMLWNVFKMLTHKMPKPIILFFQSSEFLDPCYLSKLYFFAKEMQRIQIITSLNTGIQTYAFRNYEGMDHRIRMDLNNLHELQEIMQQRAVMTFPTSLMRSSLDLLVDFAAEFEYQTPGSCINLLKACYPQILETHDLTPDMLRLASRYHFDGLEMDTISMADFVSNTTFEDRCFLEYLVNFFRDRTKYYIRFEEIKKVYKMTCEELGMAAKKEEFFMSFTKIAQSQILRPSLLHTPPNMQKVHGIYQVPYYLSIPIDDVNEVMDVSFGIIGKENL